MNGQKIVLIEDDEILSKVIYEELKAVGFSVLQAFDGEDGLKMIKSEKPDLVLLDIMLPKKNGFEVLKEIKGTPEFKEIPFFLLTMLGSDDDIKKGLRLGADNYIVKSQHAVAEIIEKIKDFFSEESHPKSGKSGNDEKINE